ncbi:MULTISPECIES: TlpA family protein disulfide reductase [Sphingobacterium]|jgi:thiol-disulfide isomerase/thioredoxin|uniref:Cytochrome C biogenesis protein n=1 Tax=Sphingobacterium multivorum TaxID=28454 RepID=A0A654DVR6_SPHMU|nr:MULTISPECIES: TlpA disulfide reductase family protein [Sphingobacterium]HAE65631.1 TlpA family protein disulfide reductase [Sphingobacterium sp.]OFV20858.1 cytochrome C biogenesis protein [Sphingobacterium sp. HMSC13C05]QQT46135.1 TlpA family protein disulfide reductase [Sphingobacterium multivorum]QQT61302.1 TlpA family protein disulfide reductase [Sphingobacterium multivorum]SUJ31239.1 Thiol-disulfide oxidoreductase resA [Sphingobacterium multivorum]
MSPKTRNIIGNVVFVLLIGLLIWPTSRSYFQQFLMKLGFFNPKLELVSTTKESDRRAPETSFNHVSFVNSRGETIKVADLKGKVVFINFWATWCAPCRAEMPSINVLYERYKDDPNIVFLIVEIEGDRAKAEAFMKEQQLILPISFPNSDIPKEWLSGPIPSTVILDKAGKIATRHEGMADYSSPDVGKFMQDLINK